MLSTSVLVLNRLDDLIVFHPLSKEEASKILVLILDHVIQKLKTQDIVPDLTPEILWIGGGLPWRKLRQPASCPRKRSRRVWVEQSSADETKVSRMPLTAVRTVISS